MSPAGKRIFVSYSHKDHEDSTVVGKIFTHLYGLKQSFTELEIWIDQKMIRVGDQWLPEIDGALAAADLAVMIISPEFLASSFITQNEQPRLLERRTQGGLRLVPILLTPCLWPGWLSATEIRPHGDRSLSEIYANDPPGVDRALKQVMEEVAELLAGASPRSRGAPAATAPVCTPQTPRGGDTTETKGIALPTETLLSEMAPDAGAALAKLVRDIKSVTGLSGSSLFDAVRFFVEFELLRNDEPTSPSALERAVSLPERGGKPGPLLANLLQRAKTEDFGATLVEVSSHFFARTNEAAGLSALVAMWPWRRPCAGDVGYARSAPASKRRCAATRRAPAGGSSSASRAARLLLCSSAWASARSLSSTTSPRCQVAKASRHAWPSATRSSALSTGRRIWGATTCAK